MRRRIAAVLALAVLPAIGCGAAASRGGTLVVDNQTDEVLTLRDYPFGDGPGSTSKRIEVPPHASTEAKCGYLREFDLTDDHGRPLPILVPCPSKGRETVVVTPADLPD